MAKPPSTILHSQRHPCTCTVSLKLLSGEGSVFPSWFPDNVLCANTLHTQVVRPTVHICDSSLLISLHYMLSVAIPSHEYIMTLSSRNPLRSKTWILNSLTFIQSYIIILTLLRPHLHMVPFMISIFHLSYNFPHILHPTHQQHLRLQCSEVQGWQTTHFLIYANGARRQ